MRRLSVATALLMALLLSGCTASSVLSAATSAIGGGSGLTAQVGQNNTKQGIGATLSTEDKNETTVKDSTVGSVDSSHGKAVKAQNISTGSITADRIEVKNTDTTALILAFLAGLLPVILVEAGIVLIKRKRASTSADSNDSQTS